MSEIKKILFPTDFSETAGAACVHAVELARRFDARITVLHVRTVFADDPARIKRELEAVTDDDPLHQRMGQLFAEGVEVETKLVRDVSQAGGILDFLLDNPIDLVVMGTHGRSGLTHFLLGSVAEKVVRHAPCPVLTVGHAQTGYRGSPRYQKILVGFDFSRHSIEAVRHASELARIFDGTAQAIYVLSREIQPAYFDHWSHLARTDFSEIAEEARKALDEVVAKEGLSQIKLEVVTTNSAPHREIADFAKNNAIDLIVMGTHGLSGIEHALLGSTTEKVVRSAPCPVLTYKLGQS